MSWSELVGYLRRLQVAHKSVTGVAGNQCISGLPFPENSGKIYEFRAGVHQKQVYKRMFQ